MDHDIDPRLQEPLDDEERRLMDPDTWDWDSTEELPPAENSGAVFLVRFSLEEMQLVGRAADAAGMSIYDYIRESAVLRSMPKVPA